MVLSIQVCPLLLLVLLLLLLRACLLTGLAFNHSVDLERRQIVVSVSPDQEVNAVLCYEQALACRNLLNHSPVQIRAPSWKVTLSYDYLLPCLCIQVFSFAYDSNRTQHCPFKRDTGAYGPDLRRLSYFSLLSEPNTMDLHFCNKCRTVPRVSLCWMSEHTASSSCQQIANSTIESLNRFNRNRRPNMCATNSYVFESVDRHSRMCFKFEYKNSGYVECRNQADRDWNVSLVTESDSFLITISSHIPANFSVFLCKPTGTGCEPSSSVYTVTQTEHSSNPQLSLPVPSLQFCVMVQRSGVHFAGAQRVCPRSEGRLGLCLVALLMGLVCGLLVGYLIRYFTRKGDSAPHWSRTVLLLYLPGCEEHTSLVCGLADVLKNEVQCNVLLDLWDCGAVARLGMVAWLYSRRERVLAENGKILIVWSQRSHGQYLQWSAPACGHSHADPHDLFNTAMACVYSDFLRCRKLRDYSLVYFEGLCSKRDIPDLFRHIPRYQLLKDFSSLVHELRNVPERPRGSFFGIKQLVRTVLQSESTRSLRGQIERCQRKGQRDSL